MTGLKRMIQLKMIIKLKRVVDGQVKDSNQVEEQPEGVIIAKRVIE